MEPIIINAAIVTVLLFLIILFIASERFRNIITKLWRFSLNLSGGGYNRLKKATKFVCVKTRLAKIVTADGLTYFRFVAVGIFLLLIISSIWRKHLWLNYLKYIFALDVAAYFTDLLDGSIAELQNTVSDRGSWLDNTADKLLCGVNLFFLVSLYQTWSLAIWIAFFEFTLSIFRFYTSKIGLNLQANKLGKAKMLCQGIGFCFVISAIPQLADPGKIILIIGVFFAGGSFITHCAQNYKAILNIRQGS